MTLFTGKTRKLPKSVRPEEWDKLIEVIPKKDITAIISFILAYGSGMRLSEVIRCSREHFRPNSIFIPESKYGVERVVPVPKGWRQGFLQHLPLNRGKRTIQRKFQKYNSDAGLNPKYTFHSLRHGFATRLLENGVPLNQIQIAMGHSDISTTGIYLKASPDDLLKSYKEKF